MADNRVDAGWWWSRDEERWNGPFTTEDAARAEGEQEALDDDEVPHVIVDYMARMELPNALPGYDADTLSEWMDDNDYGSEDDGWWADARVTDAQGKELFDGLNAVWREWCERHGMAKKVWSLESVKPPA